MNHLQPTATLHHLLQRKLLPGWLERHGLEPNASTSLLRRLAASPSALPAQQIHADHATDLAAAHLVYLGPPDPAPLALPCVFVRAVNFELTYGCNLACSHCLQELAITSSAPEAIAGQLETLRFRCTPRGYSGSCARGCSASPCATPASRGPCPGIPGGRCRLPPLDLRVPGRDRDRAPRCPGRRTP